MNPLIIDLWWEAVENLGLIAFGTIVGGVTVAFVLLSGEGSSEPTE